jgi:hypothetical protein
MNCEHVLTDLFSDFPVVAYVAEWGAARFPICLRRPWLLVLDLT